MSGEDHSFVTISSADNPRVKLLRLAAQGQVKKAGYALIAGRRLVHEWAGRLSMDHGWIVPDSFDEPLPPGRGRGIRLPPALFRDVDASATRYPLLWVRLPADVVPSMEDGVLPNGGKGLFLVVPFQDPTNVGSVIRSAVGLGATAVLLLPSAAHPFHPKAIRSSAGTVFAARLMAMDSAERLTVLGVPLVMLDAAGQDASVFRWPRDVVMVPGLEGPGVGAFEQYIEKHSVRVRLPMNHIESYNASVACSLAMLLWKTSSPPG
jgi:tRNA(Leu) C34 or U34 (ribose-2'-O)-methylase TrmL